MCQVQWIPPDPGVGLTFPAHAPCDRRLQLVRIVQAHRPERLQREVIYQIHNRIDEIQSLAFDGPAQERFRGRPVAGRIQTRPMKNRADLFHHRDFSGLMILVLAGEFVRETIQHRLQFFGRLLNAHSIDFEQPDARSAFKLRCNRKCFHHSRHYKSLSAGRGRRGSQQAGAPGEGHSSHANLVAFCA